MTRLVIVLWVTCWMNVALLGLADTTAAQTNVTNSPAAQDILGRGAAWWATYGRTPCQPITVYRGGIVGGLGAMPDCHTMYLDASLWDGAQGWPLTPVLEAHRTDLCRVMFHELGHSAGLPHAEGWVMDPHFNHQPPIGRCNLYGRGQ